MRRATLREAAGEALRALQGLLRAPISWDSPPGIEHWARAANAAETLSAALADDQEAHAIAMARALRQRGGDGGE